MRTGVLRHIQVISHGMQIGVPHHSPHLTNHRFHLMDFNGCMMCPTMSKWLNTSHRSGLEITKAISLVFLIDLVVDRESESKEWESQFFPPPSHVLWIFDRVFPGIGCYCICQRGWASGGLIEEAQKKIDAIVAAIAAREEEERKRKEAERLRSCFDIRGSNRCG